MFVCKKKNPSGVISVQIIDKSNARYNVRKTIGSSKDIFQVEELVSQAHQWIKDYIGQQAIDFTNHEKLIQTILNQISEITISGVELLLCKIFDEIGFNQINSLLFKPLVLSRIESPSSKLKTTDYLTRYYSLLIDVESIYRYMDKLMTVRKKRCNR